MTHPDDATLQTWYDGALSAAEGDAVQAHLAHCDLCTARVEGLRALGAALDTWASDAPVGFDVTAMVLSKTRDDVQANGVPVVSPAASSMVSPAVGAGAEKVVSLDAARTRRSPGRAALYPAFAAVAALVFFFVWRNPGGVKFHRLPLPTPEPVVEVGGGPGGAEVTEVDVQGAQSYSVLQIQGVRPGVTTAVVWIQDLPDDPNLSSDTASSRVQP